MDELGFYHLFVLSSLGILALIVFSFAHKWKSFLTPMQGMIISMFFGMNIGLTAGVLLGVMFQGNLFQSTILSMIIGLLAGVLCGAFFGIISLLEGLMAGLMGGMMGAMLGEMIQADQSIYLIRIFLFLSITTIYLFVIITSTKSQKVKSKLWLLNPILLGAFITLYFVWGVSYAEREMVGLTKLSTHNTYSNTTKIKQTDINVITIQAQDMKYSQTEIILEENKPVRLLLNNIDKVDHDIETKMPILQENKNSHHNHGTDNDSLHLHSEAKSTEVLSFTPIEAGTYEFVCTLPGHKELGMVGRFIVK